MRVILDYDRSTDTLSARGWLGSELEHPIAIAHVKGLRKLAKQIARRLARHLTRRLTRRLGSRQDEVGFFGFLKKAWNSAWDKAKKIAKAVGITKVLNKIKEGAKAVISKASEIIKDPRFAAAIGVTALVVPGVGPAIAAGYAGVRAAMAIADGVSKGDPQALAVVGKYATQNSPEAQKGLALIQSVAPAVQNVTNAITDNPWLRVAA